jgi:2-iminobutanoate/2-iminopropanoate deaminase
MSEKKSHRPFGKINFFCPNGRGGTFQRTCGSQPHGAHHESSMCSHVSDTADGPAPSRMEMTSPLKEADIMVIFDNPATVPAPAGGYSHVARVELGDRTLLQLSGQVAIDADRKIVGDDMAAQADFIMDNITAILAAHGASLADVVNIRTFLTDMGQLPEYGKVRAARFTGTPPTITTVEVSRLWVPGALLEVEVLAIT